MSAPRVAIGYVHNENVRALFMRSVIAARDELGGKSCPTCTVFSGPNLAKGRNMVVESFLRTDAEWIFMTDTDMMFKPDAPGKLIAHNEPIMSALCMTGGEEPVPSMYNKAGNDGEFRPVTSWFSDLVLEVDVVGTAGLVVHRDVFLEIRDKLPNKAAPWFQEVQIGDNLVGEDFVFCLRARECGFKVQVDTSVQFGHVKATILGGVT